MLLNARVPALFFANGIGDHFLNLPAVRALAHLYPGRLTLICLSGVGPTFFSGIRFRAICEVPMKAIPGGKQFDAEYVAGVVGPCDLLISLNPWHSSSVVELLDRLKPTLSVGFFREFKQRVKLNFDKHSADLAFDVARVFERSLSLDAFSAPPDFPSRFVAQAKRVRRVFPAGFRVLAVHADSSVEKMWPRHCFIRLIDMFLEKRPNFLVLVVGLADLQLDRGRHGDRVICALKLPVATSALLVGGSDLFVGIDSAMLHAADLFRVPGIGIFGPTSPNEWGFRFAPHRYVEAGQASASNEADVLKAMEELLDSEDWKVPDDATAL